MAIQQHHAHMSKYAFEQFRHTLWVN